MTLLVLTHLSAFLLGVLTFYGFTLWEGRRVCPPTDQEDTVTRHAELDPRPATPEPPRHGLLGRIVRGGPPTLGAVLLVASALVIAIGFQQLRFQSQSEADARVASQARRDAAARDACYERWGRRVTNTLEARLAANKREAAAEKARDDALDNVLLVVIGLRSTPPTAAVGDFDRTLTRFAGAKARLQTVQENADRTRRLNRPPKLRCASATQANPNPGVRHHRHPTPAPSGKGQKSRNG